MRNFLFNNNISFCQKRQQQRILYWQIATIQSSNKEQPKRITMNCASRTIIKYPHQLGGWFSPKKHMRKVQCPRKKTNNYVGDGISYGMW